MLAVLLLLTALDTQTEVQPWRWDAGAETLVAGGELFGGFHGAYFVTSPRATLTLPVGAFIGFSMPIALLRLGAYDFFGPGDLSAQLGWRWYLADTVLLRAGVWTMWPTGDPHRGLGTGHVMLAPRVEAATQWKSLLAAGALAVRGAIPLGEHGLHNHQAIIAPHDLADIAATFKLGTALANDIVRLWAVAAPVLVLVPHPVASPGNRLSLGGELSVRFGYFRAAVTAMAPVTTNRTESWLASLSLGVSDDAPAALLPPPSCH